jgi:hypothetical protein
MAVIQIQQFGGEVPVQGVRALPPSAADSSVNTWLYSGELRALHPNAYIRDLISTTRKIFRIPKGTMGGDPSNPSAVPPPSYLGDSTWLEFSDPYTDIVRGPLVNDSFKRWYFCSPSTGLMVNSLARLQVGSAAYKAGVPAPANNVGIAIAGGSGQFSTRAYTYTWINIWGEESGPSPAVTAAGFDNATWTISGINDPTTEFANYVPYQKKQLYRSVTGATGVTTYFRVATIASGTTTFADSATDAAIVGHLQFDNANGVIPPADIQGIVAMPNGFLMGWHDSDIYFSEPYKVHSWPPEYVVSAEYPIVGMGVFGQSCAVLTQGYPIVVSGVVPATTALAKTNVVEPCLSRGSIVTNISGVFYASPNGLVSVSAAGVQNITQSLITKEEWVGQFQPAYLRACRYQQGYLALRAVPNMPNRTAFFLDLSSLTVAVNELSEFTNGNMVQGDVWSGEVFTIKDSKLYHHDPSDSTLFLPFQWRSKEFQYVKPDNFVCYEIYWDDDRFDATSTDAPTIIPPGVAMHLRVLADRNVVYDHDVPVNGKPVKLPSGFKAAVWQFEISGRAPVFTFQCATSVKELAHA